MKAFGSIIADFVWSDSDGHLLDRLRKALLKRLASTVAMGRLDLTLPDSSVVIAGDAQTQPVAELQIKSWRVIDRILLNGDIGFAEAYIDGLCDTSNLKSLFDVTLANEATLGSRLMGSWFAKAANRFKHVLNANTRQGSRANIAFHYDLGNGFYRAWLDPTMTYSAALFTSASTDLETAQLAKYRHICRVLDVKPGDSILEIGCGWGGFAEIAAREFGAAVHGITLSREQLAYARERVARENFGDQVTFEFCDYRDATGQYDHVVSIEMFEAVGRTYWKTFCDQLRAVMKPGGKAFLQIITIDDNRFDDYAARPDFIQRYVFPGGMLPSPERLIPLLKDAGLRLLSESYDGADYERTLIHWRHAFLEAWPKIAAQGFGERFKRLWLYYLEYCEAGFRHRTIDLGRFVLVKPR